MKRLTAILIIIAAMSGSTNAAISTVTTNYFTNTAFVATTAAWTNAFTGNAIVFDVAELGALTDAQSSNDVRAVMYNMLAYLYDQIQALASSNRPANFTIQEFTSESVDTGDIQVNHTVKTKQTVDTFTIPTE